MTVAGSTQAKMKSKFSEPVDHKVKVFSWPFWLLPLLFLCLLLVLGLFIFITLHSTDGFCLFHCDPEMPSDQAMANSNEKRSHVKEGGEKITVKGNITFPSNHIPESFPQNSQLKVEFQDTSIADGASLKICVTKVDLTTYKYKKGSPIKYFIKCQKPKFLHSSYSVSAVLNMGWIPEKGENADWLRKGDFLTDTIFNVELTKERKEFERDIELAYYN